MLIDKKDIDVVESASELSFTTTGGSSWTVWDRFISYGGEQLFHIGNICGTCAFFFSQLKNDLKSGIRVDPVRDILNKGLQSLDDHTTGQLKTILPDGKYQIFLMEIMPYLAKFNTKGDYFKEDQSALWGYVEDEIEDKTGIPYYRGTDIKIGDTEKLFEFFIPLYQLEFLNEERIEYYRNQIRSGAKPTAVALSVVDVKESMIYDEQPEDKIICHWSFANYLLDGHHKIAAAALERKPITLVSFIAKDHSWLVTDRLTEIYSQK